ncbi:MAG: DNA double-strand break repair nuclease NurA [Thermoplasmata archaeon]
MPLELKKVISLLESKKEVYKGFDATMLLHYKDYADKLLNLSASSSEIKSKLADNKYPGSLPTKEFYEKGLIIRFKQKFTNHREARNWACEILRGLELCASDGSQIYPSKDLSIPIGVVNVSWFYNNHNGKYEKGNRLELLSPEELFDSEDGSLPSNYPVDTKRFESECEELKKIIRSHKGTFAIFDGSLLVSFARRLPIEYKEKYIHSIINLLSESRTTQSPVIGYIDVSYARDIAKMLSVLFSDIVEKRTFDAGLVNHVLENWGDRTCSFVCKREGIVDEYEKKNGYNEDLEIAFFYMRVNSERPIRVEFPSWALDMVDKIADAIRAQCIVGNGYPHILKVVHDYACITNQDKEKFIRIFQKFQKKEGVNMQISRKRISKY